MAVARAARRRLGELRERTLRRLAGLERERLGIVAAAESANADDEHDPEGATLAYEREHVAALIGAARDGLAEIDLAFARLADGSYGLCVVCHRQIPAERLAARPTALTCTTCSFGNGSRRSRAGRAGGRGPPDPGPVVGEPVDKQLQQLG